VAANRGRALIAVGRHAEAEAALRAAARSWPADAEIAEQLAGVVALQGRYAEAEALYRLRLEPGLAAEQVGAAAYQRGDRAAAQHWLDLALERSPRHLPRAAALRAALAAERR
jgi:tetratricopeptide (TPR) repeat protein